MFINIHTHKPLNKAGDIEIVNLDIKNGFPKILMKGKKYTLGLHPWDIESYQNLYPEIKEQVTQNNQILAVGEFGLDFYCSTPKNLQKQYFMEQLELARQTKKICIVHCVKAYGNLLEIVKKTPNSPTCIIHGFNASIEIANQLIQEGCFLSFGHLLLNKKTKAHRFFSKIPNNKFFLETDEQDISIEEIYNMAAKLKSETTENLKSIIFGNFRQLFPGYHKE